MFFGAADKIMKISANEDTKCMVIRMRSVNAIDATAVHSLEVLLEDCKKKNISVVLSHVNEQPMNVMKKSGLQEQVGASNFCKHIDDALARAQEIVNA